MMKFALEEAKIAYKNKEIPIGAIICDKYGNIIARAHNECEKRNDPTAHAEILAIQRACKYINNWRLTDYTMYVTVEPCPMCAGAILQSRLGYLFYGASQSKTGACDSVFNIVNNPYLSHQTNVISGIMEDACRDIVQKFFRENNKR